METSGSNRQSFWIWPRETSWDIPNFSLAVGLALISAVMNYIFLMVFLIAYVESAREQGTTLDAIGLRGVFQWLIVLPLAFFFSRTNRFLSIAIVFFLGGLSVAILSYAESMLIIEFAVYINGFVELAVTILLMVIIIEFIHPRFAGLAYAILFTLITSVPVLLASYEVTPLPMRLPIDLFTSFPALIFVIFAIVMALATLLLQKTNGIKVLVDRSKAAVKIAGTSAFGIRMAYLSSFTVSAIFLNETTTLSNWIYESIEDLGVQASALIGLFSAYKKILLVPGLLFGGIVSIFFSRIGAMAFGSILVSLVTLQIYFQTDLSLNNVTTFLWLVGCFMFSTGFLIGSSFALLVQEVVRIGSYRYVA